MPACGTLHYQLLRRDAARRRSYVNDYRHAHFHITYKGSEICHSSCTSSPRSWCRGVLAFGSFDPLEIFVAESGSKTARAAALLATQHHGDMGSGISGRGSRVGAEIDLDEGAQRLSVDGMIRMESILAGGEFETVEIAKIAVDNVGSDNGYSVVIKRSCNNVQGLRHHIVLAYDRHGMLRTRATSLMKQGKRNPLALAGQTARWRFNLILRQSASGQ